MSGTRQRLAELVRDVKPSAPERIGPEDRLQTDLGMSSVEIIDLVVAAEDAFGIELPDDETGDLLDATVAELAARIDALAGG